MRALAVFSLPLLGALLLAWSRNSDLQAQLATERAERERCVSGWAETTARLGQCSSSITHCTDLVHQLEAGR